MGTTLTDRMTRSIEAAGIGSRTELAQLVDALYDHVRRISASEMRKAFAQPLDSLTIQPTAIANDAIVRVLQQRNAVQNQDQFFALATRFIRQLVIDYQRHRLADKRGAGKRGVGLERAEDVPIAEANTGPIDIMGALDKLQAAYPRKAEVVTLHVVCGHPLSKVAEMLDISSATAERDWAFAKAWLSDATRSTK